MLQDLAVAPAFVGRAAGFMQIVADEAGAVQGLAVLSADEVRSALEQEADKALLGCSGTSCLAELAEALDAELVISGRVDAAPGGGALVALTLLNARAVVVTNRVVMRWGGPEAELPEVLRAAAQTLLLEAEARPPGSLQVLGLPPDARVFVDDEERTADHRVGSVGALAIGPHVVRAEADGMEPSVAHVIIKPAQQTVVTLTLEGAGLSTPLVVLGIGGAVVLGGGAALALAYALGQSDVVVSASVPAVGVNDAESLRKGARP